MKLKICGVQSVEEAVQLAEMGVDFIGLNFVPGSSRRIDFETGQAIAATLKHVPVKIVILFQNQPLNLVQKYIQAINPAFVQLHGDETDEFIGVLDAPVIKSITQNDQTVSSLAQYYLLDRNIRGHGPPVEMGFAKKIIATYPDRVFLAGGLTPDNLPNILASLKPFAVDIAAGVRTEHKLDFDKVASVLETIRRQS